MTAFKVNDELIRNWCETHMSTHTDWTGTRVETKLECDSVDDFVTRLMDYIKDNQY